MDTPFSIAVIITDRNTDVLCQQLQTQLPQVNIQQWPDISAPETVRMAVLWNHPPGITENMTKLETVVSMGAGMDHIDQDSHILPSLSRKRIVTLALKQNMAQYVLQHILSDYRRQAAYQQQQIKRQWQVLEADERSPTIGFLGLGELGGFVADRCAELGFATCAWTKQQKHPVHACFHGTNGLYHVCQNSQYLVILLPLNQHTRHIINSETLSHCQSDAMLINVGRGAHVKQDDLINALNAGAIRRAVLDVFEQEPLPSDHVFWSHPQVTITPHSSARSDVTQTAAQIVNYYRALPPASVEAS